MKFKIEIESIKPSDLPFLERMFGVEVDEWKGATNTNECIKPHLDSYPNDVSSHINELVRIGIDTLMKEKNKN